MKLSHGESHARSSEDAGAFNLSAMALLVPKPHNPVTLALVRLSPTVYHLAPSLDVQTERLKNADPSLIILTTWLDASQKHIAKYLAGLRILFPASNILLVTTGSFKMLFQSSIDQVREISPAVNLLKQSCARPNNRILLYSLSNGGATAACILAKSFREQTGHCLPLSAMVLDSAPGNGSYQATIRAFSSGFPRAGFLQAFNMLLLRLFFRMLSFVNRMVGAVNVIEDMRKELNDRAVFSEKAERLYIYSIMDQIVPWQDVEAHIKDAEVLGYRVSRVKFVGSGHVGHLVMDEARYWQAVQRLWHSAFAN